MTTDMKTCCGHCLSPAQPISGWSGRGCKALIVGGSVLLPGRRWRGHIAGGGAQLGQGRRAIFLALALKALLMLSEIGDAGLHLAAEIAFRPWRGDRPELRRRGDRR